MGKSQLFNTGGLRYVFDGRTPIPVKLNKAEAEFIYSCITKSEDSHNSLLAYILNHTDVPILENYLELGAVWNELPTELKGLQFETDQRNGYVKIDKETRAMSVLSEDEFWKIKEEQE